MIEPINSLAFSIQANRGVYAVLLGSGVSRSAKIPTGWEVTLDLVQKLAALSGEKCNSWWRLLGHKNNTQSFSSFLSMCQPSTH